METLIVEPKNRKQLETVEAILKALDVSFKKEAKNPYNPDFIKKIKKSQKQAAEGEVVTYSIEQLEELCK